MKAELINFELVTSTYKVLTSQARNTEQHHRHSSFSKFSFSKFSSLRGHKDQQNGLNQVQNIRPYLVMMFVFMFTHGLCSSSESLVYRR